MSFVQRELSAISTALIDENNAGKRAELYAAQQALAWALEPSGYKRPLSTVLRNNLKGTPEDSTDYSADPHPIAS